MRAIDADLASHMVRKRARHTACHSAVTCQSQWDRDVDVGAVGVAARDGTVALEIKR